MRSEDKQGIEHSTLPATSAGDLTQSQGKSTGNGEVPRYLRPHRSQAREMGQGLREHIQECFARRGGTPYEHTGR